MLSNKVIKLFKVCRDKLKKIKRTLPVNKKMILKQRNYKN